MNAVALQTDRQTDREPVAHRRIVLRSRGRTHGPITRLMSPGDLGEYVKPFVFLDFFEAEGFHGKGFAPHPHSGIATHTTLLRGATDYGDATGASGTLPENGLEWMRAGGGVWHWGSPKSNQPVRGYQLWIALPASLELANAESQYVDPSEVPSDGRVRVLLGSYENMASTIRYTEPLTYLHVRLRDGERFTFTPPQGHDVAWLAVHQGALRTGEQTLRREMAVFAEGSAAIEIVAEGDAEFVLGSARKHPHDLVTGSYSVHTSEETLVRGEDGIERAFNGLTREAIARYRGL